MASGIKFEPGKLRTVGQLDKQVERAVSAVMQYWDGPIEAAMKRNAPWTDRTTNARNGLKAKYSRAGGGQAIVLSHSVHYGIYLETKYSARDAIILPTIRAYGPKVMRSFQGLLDRLGSATPNGGAP